MTEHYEALDFNNLKPRFFYSYKKKPSVLCVYKKERYNNLAALKPYLSEFFIEYVNTLDFFKFKNFSNYDLIWSYGGSLFENDFETKDFVEKLNKKRINVCASFFESLSSDYIFYNNVSINNPELYGKEIFRTNDCIDLIIYGHDRLIERRGIKVLFFEDCDIKNQLQEMLINCDVLDSNDPIECNKKYNECSIFVDFKKGLDSRILELSACGVVGVTKNEGYYKYIKNKYVYSKKEDIFSIIEYLYNDKKSLYKTSKSVSKEMINWDVRKNAWMYLHFLQSAIKFKKCLVFV